MDVSESQENILEDHLLLCNRINLHKCSDYFLRAPRNNPSNPVKQCRMEFGTSLNPGKPLRDCPAIVKDRNGSLRLEMERDHPNLVQHSQIHTQAWRANGDISLILSKSGPDNPSVNEIIAVEKYVSGYACKGNEPTGTVADLFNDMVNSADQTTGSTTKSLCTKLLMGTVKRDISAVETSFELSALPLYRSSHAFQNISLTGARILEKNGSTATKQTPLDKYLSRPETDHCSWYNFICKSGKVPVISGGSLRATCPLTEDYCKNTLILHWHDWRKFSDIKDDNVSWNDLFMYFLLTGYCPNFVKADVERANNAAHNAAHNGPMEDESDDDNSEFENMSQPDWIQVVKPNAEFTDNSEFKFDDGGPDYNWSVTKYKYPADLGVKFIENLKIEESNSVDKLSFNTDINISSLNEDQMFAFNLVIKTLFDFQNNPVNFTPLRLIVGGSAGCGKTYLIKCLVKAVKCFF
ncbi:unnamed protein product [Mytilus coruscus]|uniref:DNA helicase n=1 Tax=Mytilus coruscus TaxID=42192 RepID=A0A6J8E383_MYTCO|nr:unnamed protein product [Mytilus coruscus]